MARTAFREGIEGLELMAPRLTLGSSMLYHGYQKLTPKGQEENAPWFEHLGFKPGKRWVTLTGLAEAGAGILSLLGIGTRVAALAVLTTQAVAVGKVHKDKGYDNSQGGFEYNLMLMAVAAGLLLSGPGRVSLKHLWHARRYRGLLGAARRAVPGWGTRALLSLQ